ncbi:MAG: hypothetical protein R2836_04270 [Chitinophagales bacterium]
MLENYISIPIANGTALEGVSVDKNDPNTVLVTANGFNSSGKVYRVENALSSSLLLQRTTNKMLTLPYMPVYDCVIDIDD